MERRTSTNTTMEDTTLIKLWACTLLAILEAAAIATGNDGMYFLPVVAAISGIAGYEVKEIHLRTKHFYHKILPHAEVKCT